ncbi:MAG: hypothetical protein AAF696_08540 [Bacteroidota bacterium]
MNSILKFFASQIGKAVGLGLLIILALFILNKISPFIKTTYTVEDSALSVKEVREIGELISAEYYGEIVHSLTEGFKLEDEDSFEKFYDTLSYTIKLLYAHHQEEGKKEERVWEEAFKYFKEFSSERLRPQYFHLMRLTNRENRALKKRKKRAELAFIRALKSKDWASFIRGKERQLEEEIRQFRSTQLNEIEIHYLCRGWVKAGYNLSQITESNWQKDDADSVLYLKGVDPYILAADINPWFIPPQGSYTKGVPGYELLRVRIGNKEIDKITFNDARGREKAIPFHFINRTKKTARMELIREAMERDLFATAKSSAEESLFQLFRMADSKNTQGINRIEIVHSEDFAQKLADLEASRHLDFESLDAFQQYIHLE